MSFRSSPSSSSPAADRKAALRSEVKASVNRLTAAERIRQSERIVENLLRIPEVACAKAVVLYAALPGEPDLSQLPIRLNLSSFLLPRIEEQGLRFYEVFAWQELKKGRFHVDEPDPGQHNTGDPAKADVVLVPGMAFTAGGLRLGRGGGYYDRFLGSLPANAAKIGICFSCQIVASLPVERHDIAVDRVVTDLV